MELKDFLLLGIGHQARNGKDTLAGMIGEMHEHVKIFHFADALYEEVSNPNLPTPLIQRLDTDHTMYLIYDGMEGSLTVHKLYYDYEVPELHRMFENRRIKEYLYMTDKDPELLQWWGTNFRKKENGEDYWYKKTEERILAYVKGFKKRGLKEKPIIVIPDCRFVSEVEWLKKNSGLYIRVIRLNEDGTQYIATDRDPNHASEVNLLGYKPDYLIAAKNIETLQQEANRLMTILKPLLKKREGHT